MESFTLFQGHLMSLLFGQEIHTDCLISLNGRETLASNGKTVTVGIGTGTTSMAVKFP